MENSNKLDLLLKKLSIISREINDDIAFLSENIEELTDENKEELKKVKEKLLNNFTLLNRNISE